MGLLKGLDPLLTADLLHILRSMGHGDKLATVDANFPAAEVATETITGKHVLLTCDAPTATEAIVSVLPLDSFDGDPARHMSPQEGAELPPLSVEVTEALITAVETGGFTSD